MLRYSIVQQVLYRVSLDKMHIYTNIIKKKLKTLLLKHAFKSTKQANRGETLSSATQHAMPLEFGGSGERIVLILGSLCLPCCVRDTA